MNCGNETKMKKWSSQWTQFMQLRNGVWTRDLAITYKKVVKNKTYKE